jgi:hypothetical protein
MPDDGIRNARAEAVLELLSTEATARMLRHKKYRKRFFGVGVTFNHPLHEKAITLTEQDFLDACNDMRNWHKRANKIMADYERFQS